MRTHWRCRADWLRPPVECHEGGVYDHKGGSETGPTHKHTTDTKHPTETSVRGWDDEDRRGAVQPTAP